jgi:hypothetical protein
VAQRKKVSTTISPDGYTFIRRLIRSGKARTFAEAFDLVIEEARRADNRARLERATADYFESLSPEVQAEERELGEFLSRAAGEVNFDE